MAPRVSVCAGHQANMILRLILGLNLPKVLRGGSLGSKLTLAIRN